MDEAYIRGLVIGVVFMLAGLTVQGIWRLLKAQSLGARRLKFAASVSVLLFLLYAMAVNFGPTGVLITVAILVTGTWVALGFRKRNSSHDVSIK